MAINQEQLNALTHDIIGAAIRVHRELGPGLLESAYQACLQFELHSRGVPFKREMSLPVTYLGHKLDAGYRLDFVVSDTVVVEVKAVDDIAPIHEAQTLTYLRLSGCPAALLLNFNVVLLKDGIRRFVAKGFAKPPMPSGE